MACILLFIKSCLSEIIINLNKKKNEENFILNFGKRLKKKMVTSLSFLTRNATLFLMVKKFLFFSVRNVIARSLLLTHHLHFYMHFYCKSRSLYFRIGAGAGFC